MTQLDDVTQENNSEQHPDQRRRTILRVTGIIFIGLALLLIFYGVVALFAYQNGEQLRVERQASEQVAELDHQLALAESDLAAGNFDLALRRLEWVMGQDRDNAQAVALQVQVQEARVALLTPSPTPVPSPTPEVMPTVDPAIALDETAAGEGFRALTALVENGQWATAVPEIIQFQNKYPSHRRGETDQMLYDAYIGLGRRLLMTNDQIERGLFYLNQAQRLGTLPEEVVGEMSFAELYLEGIVFYDVNWEAFFYYFRELCTYTPAYQNSCGLLVDGLTKHADRFTFQEDWCPAQSFYAEAIRWQGNQGNGLGDKLSTASANCALATPTPSVITGTVGITATEGITVSP